MLLTEDNTFGADPCCAEVVAHASWFVGAHCMCVQIREMCGVGAVGVVVWTMGRGMQRFGMLCHV